MRQKRGENVAHSGGRAKIIKNPPKASKRVHRGHADGKVQSSASNRVFRLCASNRVVQMGAQGTRGLESAENLPFVSQNIS